MAAKKSWRNAVQWARRVRGRASERWFRRGDARRAARDGRYVNPASIRLAFEKLQKEYPVKRNEYGAMIGNASIENHRKQINEAMRMLKKALLKTLPHEERYFLKRVVRGEEPEWVNGLRALSRESRYVKEIAKYIAYFEKRGFEEVYALNEAAKRLKNIRSKFERYGREVREADRQLKEGGDEAKAHAINDVFVNAINSYTAEINLLTSRLNGAADLAR